jgi:hypothetical protein
MCLVSIQHHNAHLDTVRSRCYIPRHLNNDIYSCSLHQRYLYHTLSLESIAIKKTNVFGIENKNCSHSIQNNSISVESENIKINTCQHINDHLFYQIVWGLKWLVLEIDGIVHHHCSNLLFIINAHALIVIILIKV